MGSQTEGIYPHVGTEWHKLTGNPLRPTWDSLSARDTAPCGSGNGSPGARGRTRAEPTVTREEQTLRGKMCKMLAGILFYSVLF